MLSISAIERPLSSTWVRPVLRGFRLRVLMPKSRPFLNMGAPRTSSHQAEFVKQLPRRCARCRRRVLVLLGARCAMCEVGPTVRTWLALGLVLLAGVARAQNRIVLDEVLGSWLGDDEVQYVELRMLETGQKALAGVGVLFFD